MMFDQKLICCQVKRATMAAGIGLGKSTTILLEKSGRRRRQEVDLITASCELALPFGFVGGARFDINTTPYYVDAELLKRAKHKFDKVTEQQRKTKLNKKQSKAKGKGKGQKPSSSSEWAAKRKFESYGSAYGAQDHHQGKRSRKY